MYADLWMDLARDRQHELLVEACNEQRASSALAALARGVHQRRFGRPLLAAVAVAVALGSPAAALVARANDDGPSACTAETAKVSLGVAYDTTAQADIVAGAEATGLPTSCDGQELVFEFIDKQGTVIHTHVGLIKEGASVISCEARNAPRAADIYLTKVELLGATVWSPGQEFTA